MGNTPQPPQVVRSPSERCAQLLRRITTSHATMNSAFDLLKVSDVFKESVARNYLSPESGLLALFRELEVPESFDPSIEIPRIAKQLAEQTAVNLEVITSAATIILSHSTADDVFTGACELSIDLAPKEWVSELKSNRNVPLRSLIEKGIDGVLAHELKSLRAGLGGKSLPGRAEMLFRHVRVQQHPLIPPTDPSYFRISTLKEADDLRISIVHGNGLPRIESARSENVMRFLHEAAFVAIRSVITAYRISQVWDNLMKLYTLGNQRTAPEN